MKRLVIAAAIAALVPVSTAVCAPKAKSAEECEWFWDIAITARANAMERVDREVTRRVIWRVFVPVGADADRERGIAIGNLVVDAAYSTPWAAGETPGHLAGKLKAACLGKVGDMDGVLGTST